MYGGETRYGAGTTGPSTEPAYTTGTQFDGTDVYPDDINNAADDQTFLFRSSGSPYGSSSSVLTLPAGTTIAAYNGESVTLNGRIVVGDSNCEIRGLTVDYGGTSTISVVDVDETGATPITGTVISGCTIRNNGGKHTLDINGNVDGIDVVNTHLERYGTNNHVADPATWGDPGEFWVQKSTYNPTNIYGSNIKCTSTSGGTADSVQLQNAGVVVLENFSFAGASSENWLDMKTDGSDDYTIRRWHLPPKSSALVTRANAVVEECLFEGNGTTPCKIEIGVGGQSPLISDFHLQRCIWTNQGTNDSSHRALQIQECTGLDVVGCQFAGGDIRNQATASGVLFRSNVFDDTDLDNSGTYTCEDNLIINGSAGWGSCTGTQTGGSGGGGAGIALVQSATGTSGDDNVTATFSTTPTEGNLIVGVYYCKLGGTSPTITGFTKTIDFNTAALSDRYTLFWKVAGASESTAVTCDYGTSTDNSALVIAEYAPGSGNTWTSPVDVSASSDITQNTTSKTSGTTSTTTQDDVLAVAGWGLRDTSATSRTYTNTFTEVAHADFFGDTQALMAYKVVAATGTQESTASWTGLNDATGGIVAFKNTAA